MARKSYNQEDILRFLREIDIHFHDGLYDVSACLDPPFPTLFAKKKKSMPSPPL